MITKVNVSSEGQFLWISSIVKRKSDPLKGSSKH